MSKIVLIDGNSLMYRAYYATGYDSSLMMKTSDGFYTNAIYTFIILINKIREIENISNIFVAFDKGKKTLRHQEYDEYKGKRKKMPEELAMQIPYIKEYLDLMNIKRLELDDYEADDIIGTLSKKSMKCFDEVIVISGDKDLLQLVEGNISVLINVKGITNLDEYNMDNFFARMNFLPKQLIDYKGMVGDVSDNLKGIAGIGPKTAIKLLNEYETLENIIANVDKLSPKLQALINENKETGLQTKHLATIYCDAKIDVNLVETAFKEPDYAKLRKFYERFEFNSFLRSMHVDEKKATTVIERNFEYHYNVIDKKWLSELQEVNIEVELSGDNYHQAEPIGFCLTDQKKGYYFDALMLQNEDIVKVIESQSIQKNCLDSKKVIVALKHQGLTIKGIDFDLLLASYVYNPILGTKDYNSIFNEFIKVTLPFQEDVYGKKKIYKIEDFEILMKYSLDKCSCLAEVKPIILEKLSGCEAVNLFKEIELPLAQVLADVEMNGFKVDRAKLDELGEIFNKKMAILEQEIYELAGHEFNISSPKQLGVIIFEEMNLAKGKKNKTGYSTSADILEELAQKHPFPAKILEYRKYNKLITTYVHGLAEAINPYTKKIHTTYKQSLTLTGRLSSVEPNIQNIPVRTEEGRLIRSIFVPSTPDGVIVSADYSQIELRVLAVCSNCQTMIEEFNQGHDFHTTTAARIYGVKLEDVKKEMRRVAKAVNFGIVYGMSDWGLAKQLGIAQYDATIFIKRYFQAYPEIRTFLDNVVAQATEKGYTTTLFMRRRYIPEIKNSNHALREFGKRTAMNAPIQGTAADIMKIAMIKVAEVFEANGLNSKIVAQVHDELIVDVVKSEITIVKELLKETMEKAVNIGIKLAVDVEEGLNWDLK